MGSDKSIKGAFTQKAGKKAPLFEDGGELPLLCLSEPSIVLAVSCISTVT
jgi:hypothetical protein